MQYRLSTLVKAGILRNEGAGRNSRYYIKEASGSKQSLERVEILQDIFRVPLSKEAEELQKLISVPIQLRSHVSYRKEFLDSYEPNKTFYLFISKLANESVPSKDRNRFIEVAEIEVSSLHDGNFARFKIRPSEFFEWQSGWK